uniref:Uncharacterized protein n=1 Tax=Anguilla anguilla TaxID=7936 RepID=A0A0E9THY7_ANGAN
MFFVVFLFFFVKQVNKHPALIQVGRAS